MAIARVVTFEGIDSNRIAEMKREMEGNERPDDVPATEIVILHDPEADKSHRDRVLRQRGRLQEGRCRVERHAGRADAGHAHLGHEVRRRDPHDRLAQSYVSGSSTTGPAPRSPHCWRVTIQLSLGRSRYGAFSRTETPTFSFFTTNVPHGAHGFPFRTRNTS